MHVFMFIVLLCYCQGEHVDTAYQQVDVGYRPWDQNSGIQRGKQQSPIIVVNSVNQNKNNDHVIGGTNQKQLGSSRDKSSLLSDGNLFQKPQTIGGSYDSSKGFANAPFTSAQKPLNAISKAKSLDVGLDSKNNNFNPGFDGYGNQKLDLFDSNDNFKPVGASGSRDTIHPSKTRTSTNQIGLIDGNRKSGDIFGLGKSTTSGSYTSAKSGSSFNSGKSSGSNFGKSNDFSGDYYGNDNLKSAFGGRNDLFDGKNNNVFGNQLTERSFQPVDKRFGNGQAAFGKDGFYSGGYGGRNIISSNKQTSPSFSKDGTYSNDYVNLYNDGFSTGGFKNSRNDPNIFGSNRNNLNKGNDGKLFDGNSIPGGKDRGFLTNLNKGNDILLKQNTGILPNTNTGKLGNGNIFGKSDNSFLPSSVKGNDIIGKPKNNFLSASIKENDNIFGKSNNGFLPSSINGNDFLGKSNDGFLPSSIKNNQIGSPYSGKDFGSTAPFITRETGLGNKGLKTNGSVNKGYGFNQRGSGAVGGVNKIGDGKLLGRNDGFGGGFTRNSGFKDDGFYRGGSFGKGIGLRDSVTSSGKGVVSYGDVAGRGVGLGSGNVLGSGSSLTSGYGLGSKKSFGSGNVNINGRGRSNLNDELYSIGGRKTGLGRNDDVYGNNGLKTEGLIDAYPKEIGRVDNGISYDGDFNDNYYG